MRTNIVGRSTTLTVVAIGILHHIVNVLFILELAHTVFTADRDMTFSSEIPKRTVWRSDRLLDSSDSLTEYSNVAGKRDRGVWDIGWCWSLIVWANATLHVQILFEHWIVQFIKLGRLLFALLGIVIYLKTFLAVVPFSFAICLR